MQSHQVLGGGFDPHSLSQAPMHRKGVALKVLILSNACMSNRLWNETVTRNCIGAAILCIASGCTTMTVDAPDGARVQLATTDMECSIQDSQRVWYAIYGVVPLLPADFSSSFEDETASYRVVERYGWLDFIATGALGLLLSVTTHQVEVSKCPALPAPEPTAFPLERYTGVTVRFTSDGELADSEIARLEELSEQWKRYNGRELVLVVSYRNSSDSIDSSGEEAEEESPARQRGDLVRGKLVRFGVHARRILVVVSDEDGAPQPGSVQLFFARNN